MYDVRSSFVCFIVVCLLGVVIVVCVVACGMACMHVFRCGVNMLCGLEALLKLYCFKTLCEL